MPSSRKVSRILWILTLVVFALVLFSKTPLFLSDHYIARRWLWLTLGGFTLATIVYQTRAYKWLNDRSRPIASKDLLVSLGGGFLLLTTWSSFAPSVSAEDIDRWVNVDKSKFDILMSAIHPTINNDTCCYELLIESTGKRNNAFCRDGSCAGSKVFLSDEQEHTIYNFMYWHSIQRIRVTRERVKFFFEGKSPPTLIRFSGNDSLATEDLKRLEGDFYLED